MSPKVFRKEVVFVFEGEIYDENFTPEQLIESLKIDFKHQYELLSGDIWPYGKPSLLMQKGKILKIERVENV